MHPFEISIYLNTTKLLRSTIRFHFNEIISSKQKYLLLSYTFPCLSNNSSFTENVSRNSNQKQKTTILFENLEKFSFSITWFLVKKYFLEFDEYLEGKEAIVPVENIPANQMKNDQEKFPKNSSHLQVNSVHDSVPHQRSSANIACGVFPISSKIFAKPFQFPLFISFRGVYQQTTMQLLTKASFVWTRPLVQVIISTNQFSITVAHGCVHFLWFVLIMAAIRWMSNIQFSATVGIPVNGFQVRWYERLNGWL